MIGLWLSRNYISFLISGLTNEEFVIPEELAEPVQTIPKPKGKFTKIQSPPPGHTPVVHGQPIPRLGGGTPQMKRSAIQRIEPPSPDLPSNQFAAGVKRTPQPIAVAPNNKVQKVGPNMRGRGGAQIRPMGHQNMPQQSGMMNHPGQTPHMYNNPNEFPNQGPNPQLQRQNSRGRGRGRGMNRQSSGGGMQQQQQQPPQQQDPHQAPNAMRGRGRGGNNRGRGQLHHQQSYQEMGPEAGPNQMTEDYGQMNTGQAPLRGHGMGRGRGNQGRGRQGNAAMQGQNNIGQGNVPNKRGGGGQVLRGRGRGRGNAAAPGGGGPALGSPPTNKKRTVMMGGQAVQPQEQAAQGDNQKQRVSTPKKQRWTLEWRPIHVIN